MKKIITFYTLSLFLAITVIYGAILLQNRPPSSDDVIYASRSYNFLKTSSWQEAIKISSYDHLPTFIWLRASVFMLIQNKKLQQSMISMICSILSIFLIFLFGRRMWSDQAGFFAALLLLTAHKFLGFSFSLRHDVPLVFFTLVTLYFLYRLIITKKTLYYIPIGLAIGLSILTKGIAGLGGCLAVFVCIFLYRLPWKSRYFPMGALLSFGLILIPEIVYQQHDISFWKEYMSFSVLSREGKTFRSILYYPVVLFSKYIYFMIFLILFPWVVSKTWGKASEKSISSQKIYIFFCVWILSFLIPFSLHAAKAAYYILPTAPAFALCAGIVLSEIYPKKYITKMLLMIVFVGAVTFHFLTHQNLEDEKNYGKEAVIGAALCRMPIQNSKIIYEGLNHYIEYAGCTYENKNTMYQLSEHTPGFFALRAQNDNYALIRKETYEQNLAYFMENYDEPLHTWALDDFRTVEKRSWTLNAFKFVTKTPWYLRETQEKEITGKITYLLLKRKF